MEESKKNTTSVGHIYSSTKNEQKQNKKQKIQKRCNLTIESLLLKKT